MHTIWQNWMSTLGLASRPKKRSVRNSQLWELASELLEGRAMLSAVSAAPAAAEVAHAKASFDAPFVAGTWNITITGGGTGSAFLTQDGVKIQGVIAVAGFPQFEQFEVSGKFTKKHPHSILDTFKLKLPVVGKILIKTNIEFPEVASPTTFSGEININRQDYAITGAKQGSGSSALPNGSKAASLPVVSGTWTLTVESQAINFTSPIQLSQSGKGGKVVSALVEFQGGTIDISGKLKPNSTELKGKATIESVQGTAKEKFSVVFFDNFTTFTGQLDSKDLGIISLDGEKVIV